MLDYIRSVAYDLFCILFVGFLCFLVNYVINFYLLFIIALRVSIRLLFGLCCVCLFFFIVIGRFLLIVEIMSIHSRSLSMRCFSNLFISTRSYSMLCFIQMIVIKMVTFSFAKSTFGIWMSLSKFSIWTYTSYLALTYLKYVGAKFDKKSD